MKCNHRVSSSFWRLSYSERQLLQIRELSLKYTLIFAWYLLIVEKSCHRWMMMNFFYSSFMRHQARYLLKKDYVYTTNVCFNLKTWYFLVNCAEILSNWNFLCETKRIETKRVETKRVYVFAIDNLFQLNSSIESISRLAHICDLSRVE